MSASLVYHTDESTAGGVSPFDAAVMGMVPGQQLLIACPYLGLDYLDRMTRRASGWRLLTDLEEWLASHAQAPRRRVVEFALANAARVRHCAGLHAKVLVAGEKALAGSANFTDKGMRGRVEVSVLFDGDESVAELRGWFESLWARTAAASELDLRAFADALPVRPTGAGGSPPLPCLFPGVASCLLPTAEALTPQEEADRRSVEALVAGKSPAVRELFGRLRPHLEGGGAKVKTTGTEGGDVRYYFARVNFADIRFRQGGLVLRLRLGERAIADPDLTWNKGDHDSADIGRVTLRAGEAIPSKVVDWIALARTFTRQHHG